MLCIRGKNTPPTNPVFSDALHKLFGTALSDDIEYNPPSNGEDPFPGFIICMNAMQGIVEGLIEHRHFQAAIELVVELMPSKNKSLQGIINKLLQGQHFHEITVAIHRLPPDKKPDVLLAAFRVFDSLGGDVHDIIANRNQLRTELNALPKEDRLSIDRAFADASRQFRLARRHGDAANCDSMILIPKQPEGSGI
jgi:hypothetical protein